MSHVYGRSKTIHKSDSELFQYRNQITLRNYSKKNKELLQDVYMYFTRVVNPKGKIQANDEGVFEWVSQKDLRSKITKPFESMDHIMKIVDKTTNFKGVVDYKEVVTYTNKF